VLLREDPVNGVRPEAVPGRKGDESAWDANFVPLYSDDPTFSGSFRLESIATVWLCCLRRIFTQMYFQDGAQPGSATDGRRHSHGAEKNATAAGDDRSPLRLLSRKTMIHLFILNDTSKLDNESFKGHIRQSGLNLLFRVAPLLRSVLGSWGCRCVPYLQHRHWSAI
jgi:hypothetical protein